MTEAEPWRELSDLLHDAKLRYLEWDPAPARKSIWFDCLRRDVGGAPLSDPSVEFKLVGVRAVLVGCEPSFENLRPSAYQVARPLTLQDLCRWPFAPQEASACVNAPACEDDALGAFRTNWLAGELQDLRACKYRISIIFDFTGILGPPANTVWLVIGCDDFGVYSAGVPLDRDTWRSQCQAWWDNWQRHWDAKKQQPSTWLGRLKHLLSKWHSFNREVNGQECCPEDATIPAAPSPPVDLTYQPPAEPAVDWQPTDAPAELLQPVTVWFEARQQRDWLRMVQVYLSPNPYWSPEEWTEQLARQPDESGRWGYARQVEQWWAEGHHAEVVVRGVEHAMPVAEFPAASTESVWTFHLRRREGRWVIRNYSQGWPPYGSALAKPASEKPWLQRWTSGPVKS
jgi:hypothetical protein